MVFVLWSLNTMSVSSLHYNILTNTVAFWHVLPSHRSSLLHGKGGWRIPGACQGLVGTFQWRQCNGSSVWKNERGLWRDNPFWELNSKSLHAWPLIGRTCREKFADWLNSLEWIWAMTRFHPFLELQTSTEWNTILYQNKFPTCLFEEVHHFAVLSNFAVLRKSNKTSENK